MIVNHRLRFIFYHVPKTGGSSVRKALEVLPDSKRPKMSKHVTPAEFATRSAADDVRGYFSFCFVRDPWERFASFHRYVTQVLGRNLPADINNFALGLADRAPWMMGFHSVRPQSDYAVDIDFVGRYERLELDMAVVAQRIGLSWRGLDRLNVSGSAIRYRDAMNDRTQTIIAEFYREDIERFGYR